MAPKGPAPQKEKVAIDKTFGLKNKNKSKSVQKYIKQITSSCSGAKGSEETRRREEKDKKEKDLQNKALLAGLFNQSVDKKGKFFDPVAKKKAKQEEEDAIAAGKKVKEEIKKDIVEGIANTIRLTNVKGVRMSELGGHPIMSALKNKHPDTFKIISLLLFIKRLDNTFWVSDEEDQNPMIRVKEDVDQEITPDERPIEEIIEEKRRALPPGGTPVTAETFKAWKEKREAERLAEVEAARKDRGKKGKDALVGMSGRDLFLYDSSLFVDADDAGAVDANEYDDRSSNPSDSEDDKPAAAAPAAKKADDASDDESEMGFDMLEQNDPKPDVAINKDLFLAGGDVDDLDDLDDDDEEEGDKGASGSNVAINKDLFLAGGDVDDLDDLDDDE